MIHYKVHIVKRATTFGSGLKGRSYSANIYRYSFGNKEHDDEVKGNGNSLDYGERMYDPRIGKFMSLDRFSSRFPGNSPYVFAGNSPISGIDINGDSLYLLAYVTGYDHGDNLFKAATLTRQYDIEHSGHFDPTRDKVAIIEVQDVSKIKVKVETAITENSKFGATVEFGVWSHSGYDGPVGSVAASETPLSSGSYQMSKAGWGNINFNWDKNGKCKAGFYGCNSGNVDLNSFNHDISFTTKLSSLSNFKNVSVLGQIDFSAPSQYSDSRNLSVNQLFENYLPVVQTINTSVMGSSATGVILNKTYLVGASFKGGTNALFGGTSAKPMRISLNGVGHVPSNSFQSGDKVN